MLAFFPPNGNNSVLVIGKKNVTFILHFSPLTAQLEKNYSILSLTLESKDINLRLSPWFGFMITYNSGIGS